MAADVARDENNRMEENKMQRGCFHLPLCKKVSLPKILQLSSIPRIKVVLHFLLRNPSCLSAARSRNAFRARQWLRSCYHIFNSWKHLPNQPKFQVHFATAFSFSISLSHSLFLSFSLSLPVFSLFFSLPVSHFASGACRNLKSLL
jgi:hypothetical protein